MLIFNILLNNLWASDHKRIKLPPFDLFQSQWDDSNKLWLRLLAETFLITAETYTENAETILNHIKNPAETLPKCRNPHLLKLPKPCRNYSKHIVKSCRNLSQDFGEVLASNLNWVALHIPLLHLYFHLIYLPSLL